MPRSALAPVWLLGLTNSVFGMYGGTILISVPQLLSIRHVPEQTIAGMTAVMASPGITLPRTPTVHAIARRRPLASIAAPTRDELPPCSSRARKQ